MSLPDGHTPIYCVCFLHEPQYIVSTLALMTIYCVYLIRTADRAQAAGAASPLARGGRGAQVDSVPSFDALPMIDRGHSGPRQDMTDRNGPGTADAPTMDRWTGRQQDGPHGAHRTAQRAKGTEGRTGGRDGQGAASDGHRGAEKPPTL